MKFFTGVDPQPFILSVV